PVSMSCCFFFQAEDGIRDRNVTGVQTCALPILEKAFLFGGRPAAGGVIAGMLIRAGWTGVDDIFSGPDNFFDALAPRENGVVKEIGRASCRERVEIEEVRG